MHLRHTRRTISAFFLIVVTVLGAACKDSAPKHTRTAPAGPAPDSFHVAFETTRGKFVVQVTRALSPHGADRFYDLVAEGFFDETAFFRVVPDFVAQFGVNNDRKVNEAWDGKVIPDDSVKVPNTRGTLVYASNGRDTRSHQLFVNLTDNKNLDRQGFSPIGRVVEGMGVVDSLYSGYSEQVSYHLLATLGNSYLKRMFPKIDYIKSVRIVTASSP
jgi:peptidyl-prolyl cis-trans isomerase A (cyclophilin A)